MTCREASNLLPLFFDGELDSRQMRAVALHGTRCDVCEGELRQMNRLQELVSESVGAGVDEVDFADFWVGIERQLGTVRFPWWQRVRAWWSDGDHAWAQPLPVFVAGAAILTLALLLFARGSQPPGQPPPQIAVADSGASIDSLDTDVNSVAVVNDPETRTTVLWVSDDNAIGGDVP